MSRPLFRFLATEIRHLEQAGLHYPEMVVTKSRGPTLTVADRELQNFASSDYLGLRAHPAVKNAAMAAVEAWGVGVGSPRIAAGTLPLHLDLERALCELLGAEEALVFPSGYHANTGLFESLVGDRDYIFCDEQSRPSLADGIRLSRARVYSFRHQDMTHLEDRLRRSRAARFRIIVTDGVFPLSGALAPLRVVYALAEKYEALVVVDDSHGIGVLGEGRGTHHQLGLDRLDVVTGTFGTVLGGGAGGFVAGKKEVIGWLRQKSRPYLTSTALAPAAAAAALKCVEIVRVEPRRRDALGHNVAFFRGALADHGLQVLPGEHPAVAVLIRDAVVAQRLTDLIHRKDVFAIGFCHPVVPEDTARIRFQVTMLHTVEALGGAAAATAEGMKRLATLAQSKRGPVRER